MTTQATRAAAHLALRTPSAIGNLLTLARRELRDAVRSRWFMLYTLAFAALGLGVSFVSATASGSAGLAGYGRTSAGLINLVILVVPLMGLCAGAGAIASDRERGMLAYVLAQPVTRFEVLLGKYLGLAAALLASLCLGFGACACVLAWQGSPTSPSSMLWMTGLSFLLALAMLSVGMLVSVLARKVSVAMGTAVFLWLTLAFVSDLGLMAGTLALRLKIQTLLALSFVNPLQVFKMWALHSVDASLDVLGPAGLYAFEEYGHRLHILLGACLAAWIVLPICIAAMVFPRRSPI
jgi:Cu-processing system permease protein